MSDREGHHDFVPLSSDEIESFRNIVRQNEQGNILARRDQFGERIPSPLGRLATYVAMGANWALERFTYTPPSIPMRIGSHFETEIEQQARSED